MPEPVKRLSPEEQRKLSPDEQKNYIRSLLDTQGASDAVLGQFDHGVATGPDTVKDSVTEMMSQSMVDGVTPPGAPPEPEIPPSARGELHPDEPPKPEHISVVPQEDDAPPADPPLQTTEEFVGDPPPGAETEPPKPSEPFLKASERTVYMTPEDAVKGIQEKDRTIDDRQKENELLRRELELAKQERESYRRRFEEQEPEPQPRAGAAPEKAPEPIPEPDADSILELWDDNPIKAMRAGFDHLMKEGGIEQDLKFIRQLKQLKADEFIYRMQGMDAPGIIAQFYTDSFYQEVEEQFPKVAGKWRDPNDPLSARYKDLYEVVDRETQQRFGRNLEEISMNGPEGAKWALGEVLGRLAREQGDDPPSAEPQAPPSPPVQTTAGVEATAPAAAPAAPSGTVPLEEAQAIARKSADIAAAAVREQARLHGASHTERAGAKSVASSTGEKKSWTPEEIRKDPSGFQKWAADRPEYNKSLDLIRRTPG